MTKLKVGSVVGILLLSVLGFAAQASASADSVDLGTAGSYSVLGATGVANTLGTTLSGDLGLSPGGLISGFPPGLVSGTTNDKNAAADQAQNDRMVAYDDARTRAADATFGGDNNGRTYTPGVYYSAGAFALTGVMTLDSEGDSNAVFIFNIDAALNTAAGSYVNLINGTQAHNVFWRVLGAAGTGADSTFSGTIISAGAVTLGASSTLNGRALSAGTVTLAGNSVQTVTGEGSANAPDAPAEVSATAGNASAAVTWTAPISDGGSVITGYTVTSSPSGRSASTTGGTSATVSGLTNGTSYTFTVVATNTVGNSGPSAGSTAVTAADVPDAPTGVSADASEESAGVTWAEPSGDGGAAITGYTVTSSPGGIIVSTNSATLSASFPNLTSGTAYTFSVVATNTAGNSVASETSSAVTPLGTSASDAEAAAAAAVAEAEAAEAAVAAVVEAEAAEAAVAAVVEAEAAVAAVVEVEAAVAAVVEAEAAVAVPATTTPAGPTLFASGTQADRGDRSSPSVPSTSAPSDMASSNWLLWALSVGATTDPAAGAPEGNWLWAVVDGNAPIRVSAADVLALESVQGSTGNWKLVEPGEKFVGTADISTLLGPPDGGRYWAASARHEVVTVYDCVPASDAFTTS
jgi:hypothetical protein